MIPIYSTQRGTSIAHSCELEKSHGDFAAFIAPLHAYKTTPRGRLLETLRDILSRHNAPRIVEWCDLYRALVRRNAASDEAILTARLLWSEYRKSTATASPGSTTRRAPHA